jgi:hypothetical protein
VPFRQLVPSGNLRQLPRHYESEDQTPLARNHARIDYTGDGGGFGHPGGWCGEEGFGPGNASAWRWSGSSLTSDAVRGSHSEARWRARPRFTASMNSGRLTGLEKTASASSSMTLALKALTTTIGIAASLGSRR